MANFGNPDGVRSQGQALLRVQQGLNAVSQYLSGQVKSLVPAGWHGHGADTFTGDWARRASQVSQLAGVCGHAGQVLVKLASDLDAANQQASRAQNLVPGPIAGRGLDPAGEQKSQQMLGQALQAAEQAWNTARSSLAGIQVPQIGSAMTVSQVDAWAEGLWHLPPPSTPWYESLWHGTENVLGDAGNFFANNASQLTQMLGDTGQVLGGLGLATLGAGGEIGGVALDATGVGAVIGVPANVVSAGAIVGGGALALHGAMDYGRAASQLHMSSDSGGGGGGGSGGTIDQSGRTFSPGENKIASTLESEGKNVKALPESNVEKVRTPDAEVDGVPTEFKSIQPGAQANTVNNRLADADGQAANAVIDARGSGLSESDARRGLARYLGGHPGRMTYIRIIGDGYNIEWP
jgi:uncharacterized protein YukE